MGRKAGRNRGRGEGAAAVMRQVAPVARRFEGASGLAPLCYTSPGFYALEVERIFRTQWLCIGRADEVGEPGSYFTLDLVGEPLVVVRGRDGEVRVLSRVCRHRAMPVVDGRGRTTSFVCPYHSWTYDLDGRLLGAPYMDRTPGFDLAECRLPAVRSELWEGFLFVNFDRQAPPLGPALAPLTVLLRNYELAAMKTVWRVPFDMECRWNWKLMCDNFMEPYHHIGTHRASLEPLMPARMSVALDGDGPYSVVYMHQRGDRAPAAGDEYGAPVLPVLDRLTAEERGRAVLVHVFPNALISLYPDHMEFYRVLPDGPDRTRLEKLMCALPAVASRPEFEAEMRRVVAGFEEIRDEDVVTCLAVQRGLASRFAAASPLCYLEKPIWTFARYVDRLVRARARRPLRRRPSF